MLSSAKKKWRPDRSERPIYLVPEARVELARAQGPLDFESKQIDDRFTSNCRLLRYLHP